MPCPQRPEYAPTHTGRDPGKLRPTTSCALEDWQLGTARWQPWHRYRLVTVQLTWHAVPMGAPSPVPGIVATNT